MLLCINEQSRPKHVAMVNYIRKSHSSHGHIFPLTLTAEMNHSPHTTPIMILSCLMPKKTVISPSTLGAAYRRLPSTWPISYLLLQEFEFTLRPPGY